MTGSDEFDNDVRGWTLNHDQFRGILADVIDQTAALHVGDSASARVLSAWWRSFSHSMVHHFRTEDSRIWLTLKQYAPEVSSTLMDLSVQHRLIERTLEQLDARMASLPADVVTAEFELYRASLHAALQALQMALREHLEQEERDAVVLLRTRVPAADYAQVERDMVKGLTLTQVADLLPRLLAFADGPSRQMMLARLPPPVRVLNRAVFTPRYSRTRARLPLGKAATRNTPTGGSSNADTDDDPV